MGTAKRVKGKTYRITYDVPNAGGTRRQKRETLYDVTRAEAEAILAKRKEQLLANGELRNPHLTVSELFVEFLERKRSLLSAAAFERYEAMFNNYVNPAMGNVKVLELRQGHLLVAYTKWFARGVRGKPLSGRTVRHLHDLIRCALNFAIRCEWATRNVAALIAPEDLPKAIKPEPVALDPAETARLLEAAQHPSSRALRAGGPSAEPWFYPAVAFAVYTGARRGEILGLRWLDLNLHTNAVTIRRSLARTHGRGLFFKEPKNGKARTIVMPIRLVAILQQHRQRQEQERDALGRGYQDGGLVFARPDGSLVNPRTFGNRVIDLAIRAGVRPITAHCLRDTHASLLANGGVALEVVSKRLGHADIRTTVERYLHVYRERDTAAARVLDSLPT